MKSSILPVIAFFLLSAYHPVVGQKPVKATITINADQGKHEISRHIYGHFSEHLGHCIYGGYWVGEDSEIPNTRGIRNDVVEALKRINIPNLRWPGGCFADEYHWKDGIGPRSARPKMVNTHWGGVTEDNSFGTHEFLDLCEQLGTEPYICGNVGSGTVEEMADWVEYINFDGVSPMAEWRRKNGRETAWGVKYWGVGNENWGCGGHMTPEFYADQYRRYATYCRNYGEHRLYKIAGGANSWDVNWTEVLMKNIPHHMMDGISLHYYTVPKTWGDKGSATQFPEDEYFVTMEKCLALERLLTRHSNIMDKYDPEKRIGLMVDEWGAWYNVEPGTNPGFLFQQSTLRDAMVSASSLNIFNNHCERVKMANIAQTVNVLQALIFTKDADMVLTPTYHVYDLFQVHHDATLLPLALDTDAYMFEEKSMPAVNASASVDPDGNIHISIVNVDLHNDADLTIDVRGSQVSDVTGRIITSGKINDHNTFDNPGVITPGTFDGASIKKGVITARIPARSVVVLEVK
jgi:alpha-N-arabinofuranosidase